MIGTLGIVVLGDDKDLTGKSMMRRKMPIWTNASDTLLFMSVMKLPTTRVVQQYRLENLYEGSMDDEGAKAIRRYEKEGPLRVCVSQMVLTTLQ